MQLKFMKYRKLSYFISGFFIIVSICSLFYKGLNYGIDFAGGVSLEVKPIQNNYNISNLREDLIDFKPELQGLDNNSILIKIGLEKGATEEVQQKVIKDIKEKLDNKVSYQRVEMVGPKIGSELVRGGIFAIFISFILMSIYIWIRYKGGYAVGSFVSLILDFILMFGFFSISGIEFNQTAIAVILMGLGYSINDKVVNYDRIEENIKKYKKQETEFLIDLSINEMLRRTIMTSVSTILALLGLYFFGGEVLKDFAIAMTFSIVMGTLTSIYISNVVLYHFNIRDN